MIVRDFFDGADSLETADQAAALAASVIESNAQLDFSGISYVSAEFAATLCREILNRRAAAVLQNALLLPTMAPADQMTFMGAVMEAMRAAQPPAPPAPAEPAAPEPPAPSLPDERPFDAFAGLQYVQSSFRRYVETFQRFENPAIADWVGEKVEKGNLLWRDPYIQLSRRFQDGDGFDRLIGDGLLHQDTPRCFTVRAGERAAPPITPRFHQSAAVRTIQTGHNSIIATGTGSGKSFCFGIPIVSECLRLRDEGVKGIKAVIIYPMNALANSQYDDFALRLRGSGLKLALYTGDTFHSEEKAREALRQITGRTEPYDSELLSREAIKQTPPDILMTNYVMLELLLTRYEDRVLFPTQHRGVLRFLVLDEVHTYTGKQGADVACLIRRLKQHTGTTGQLRCIGTSATVQSGEGEDAAALITDFATRLFGEPFAPDHVIGESYRPLVGTGDGLLASEIRVSEADLTHFDGSLEAACRLAEKLTGRPLKKGQRTAAGLGNALREQATLYFLERRLADEARDLVDLVAAYQREYRPDADRDAVERELRAGLLLGTMATEPAGDDQFEARLIPRLHAFFSQGRAIVTCLTHEGPHLNDRGDQVCTTCRREHERERPTFPLNFCRSCGHEYYGVAIQDDQTLLPRDVGAFEYEGTAAYLYRGAWTGDLPDNWLTGKGNVKKQYRDAVPEETWYCARCNRLDADCDHADRLRVVVVPEPLLLCLHCETTYTRRTREFNKLFTFGSVGRSTATDVLVSNTLTAMPPAQRKIIAFSDNRQDTALQAAHMNSLQQRLRFRQAVYRALAAAPRPLALNDIGYRIVQAMEKAGTVPEYSRRAGKYGSGYSFQQEYQDYLELALLLDLERTRQRVHQNLEDVGLLRVAYDALRPVADDDQLWEGLPQLVEIDRQSRQDYLYGLLEIMRRRLAIQHPALLRFFDFQNRVLNKLNAAALFEEIDYLRPVGYSDEADTGSRQARVYRFVHPSSTLINWTRRALNLDYAGAAELLPAVIGVLAHPDVALLNRVYVKYAGDLYMIPAEQLRFERPASPVQMVCPRCGKVRPYRHLRYCTGVSCGALIERDLSDNYFRREYQKPQPEIVAVRAAEHSGQVDGVERRAIEEQFRDPDSDLNVIVCTPTMELGIDIGNLSTVYMRNVPPSPSNYAQRAGRAGRKGQASLVSVFCGVGSYRGPHDQYFYRFPEKIIAGQISPPRFLLDNPRLIRAHIHALILETLAHSNSEKLPAQPLGIVDIEKEGYPLYASLRGALSTAVGAHRHDIATAINTAFQQEIAAFSWLDDAFIDDAITGFVDELDRAFDPWRAAYGALVRERDELHVALGKNPDKTRQFRYEVIGYKLDNMREGKRDFYVYRYLGGQGFLPNYAFPRRATTLSFFDSTDQLSRDPLIALREYAPGNFVYYSGNRYQVVTGRPATHGEKGLDFTELLICPECASAFLGAQVKQAACPNCGTSLLDEHPHTNALPLPDMVATRRQAITADEEERMREGYNVQTYYERSSGAERYELRINELPAAYLSYDHDARIISVNHGARGAEEREELPGFTYCTSCGMWLLGRKDIEAHLADDESGCPRQGGPEDVRQRILLYVDSRNDVVTLDVGLPEDILDPRAFYVTLLHTFLQAIVVALQLDESELAGFLQPAVEGNGPYRLVLYETEEGGTGALRSLRETGRWQAVLQQALTLLHEDEEGCETVCYDCLCSFYNQRDHAIMDRHLVLPLLRNLAGAGVFHSEQTADSKMQSLLAKCQSMLEKKVLQAIKKAGLRLPDHGQKTIYAGDSPISTVDFFYEPNLVVFVDGPPHDQRHVRALDKYKRKQLKERAYRIVVIEFDAIEEGVERLRNRLG